MPCVKRGRYDVFYHGDCTGGVYNPDQCSYGWRSLCVFRQPGGLNLAALSDELDSMEFRQGMVFADQLFV